MTQKQFAGGAPVSTLAGALVGTPANFSLVNGSGYPDGSIGAFVMCIDRNTPTEEKILCSTRSGTTFTITTRGYDDTLQTNHALGATCEHVIDAATVQEVNSHVNNATRDDHSQYYNQTRHDAHVHPLGSLPLLNRAAIDPTLTAPIGAIMAYAGGLTTPNGGWLVCDGSAQSRATYAALYGLIGTTYGVGDGSLTFNLPDLRSRMIVGAGAVAGPLLTPRALAATGGEEAHTLTSGELASHAHTITDPGHVHGTNDPGHVHGVTDPQHKHGVSGGDTGLRIAESNALSTRYLSLSPTDSPTTFTTMDTALTGVTIQTGSTGVTVATHSTGLTTTDQFPAAPTVVTPHNTMPPFLALSYIIKAT